MKLLNGMHNIYLLTICFLTVIHSDPADNNICHRISLAKSILRQEEHLLEIVSFLASSFNERVSKLRTCMPKRTITDLPDELIVLIFDLSEPNLRDLRHLLLISKKCRQIALSSPCLWARQTMSPKLSPYAIDAIARRSRGLGLQASFISFPGPNQTMLRDCERWSDLALRRFTEFDLMRFQASVPCTRLAGIEKMSITGSNDSRQQLVSTISENTQMCPSYAIWDPVICYVGMLSPVQQLPIYRPTCTLPGCMPFPRNVDYHSEVR